MEAIIEVASVVTSALLKLVVYPALYLLWEQMCIVDSPAITSEVDMRVAIASLAALVVISCTSNGTQGPKGDTGAQGPQGPAGLPGDAGPQGAAGEPGAQGEPGAEGPLGATGAQGAPGLAGPTGPQGATGGIGAAGQNVVGVALAVGNSSCPMGGVQYTSFDGVHDVCNGLPGDAGAQGLQGASGQQGVQGAQGPQGPQGSQGIQGLQGLQGAQGAQGPQGLQGDGGQSVTSLALAIGNAHCAAGGVQYTSADGVRYVCNGAEGDAGPQGLQGVQGAQGPQGLQGQQGAQGSQGPQGQTGSVGVSWRGAWNPSATYASRDAVSLGGSSYLALAANSGSQPPSSNWDLIAAVGDLGAPGMTWRADWNPAVNYVPGDAVSSGGSAFIAVASSIATQPPSEAWSLLASMGDTGLQGIQGLTGAQGAVGPTGATGSQGIQGLQGPSGGQGIQGLRGPSGDQGIQGLQGPSGGQGIQGLQGPSGAQGIQGLQGPAGTSGKVSFMGTTATTYTGVLGGYPGANAKCQATYASSHFCGLQEYAATGDTSAPTCWINDSNYALQGAVGNDYWNCSAAYGTSMWNAGGYVGYQLSAGQTTYGSCGMSLPLCCCK